MSSPFDAVKKHFREQGWTFDTRDEAKTVIVGYQGENAAYRAFVAVSDEDDLLECVTILPTTVPPARRATVAEFIVRGNYGMPLSKFEMDFDDGTVRLYTSSLIQGGSLTTDSLNHVFGVNFVAADRFYPAFMQVVFGRTSPSEAVESVRAGIQPASL
ncbi:MAG: YbjN domain-containing protein [Candidatus Eisenbacteria bacterium]